MLAKLQRIATFGRGGEAVPAHLRKALRVEGAISAAECALLFRLASEVSKGVIVEIGSWRGRSTVALALGALENGKVPVFAIDPHEEFVGVLGGKFGPADRMHFFKNILYAEVWEVVRLIELDARLVSKAWNNPIGLLWIDGDHRYEAVKADFQCWEPFVLENGVIAFHDSIDPNLGPFKVIEEAVSSGRYEVTERADKITVLKKK
jgi:predicted O-methyltransferase YrrM